MSSALSQCFNPRVREGRDLHLTRFHTSSSRFNPRVREGRDAAKMKALMLPPVSIHASVKDATKSPKNRLNKVLVSIHASVKDATSRHRTGERGK